MEVDLVEVLLFEWARPVNVGQLSLKVGDDRFYELLSVLAHLKLNSSVKITHSFETLKVPKISFKLLTQHNNLRFFRMFLSKLKTYCLFVAKVN